MTKEEALKTYYGYDVFRGGQEAVIDALLSGRDALAIMPTGAGKSVCYQIPALLLPGITLVVSPLVSLMRDQVTQLVQMGIPAAFLNSSLTFRQYLLALDRARAGRYKIIYVAPERLEMPGFLLPDHPRLCEEPAPPAPGGSLHRHRHAGREGGHPPLAGPAGPAGADHRL